VIEGRNVTEDTALTEDFSDFSTASNELTNKSKILDFLTLEDGTVRLTRNVGKELPLYAA
jgi:hypothetical protein